MRVSPEEITGAYLIAVARDIEKNEPDELLQQWERHILSTTCKFVVLPGQMDRYWYALRRREDVDHSFEAVHRSCFQRLWEVGRLSVKLGNVLGHSNVTAHRIHREYQTNLTNMKQDGAGAITSSFVDVAATINQRILKVPELVRILGDMDAMPRSIFNPFDSHSRLQAMINKCQTKDTLIHCAQALEYMVRQDDLPALSVMDIRGHPKFGHKGIFDLILFKVKVRTVMLAKGHILFEHSLPTQKWIQEEVAVRTKDHASWSAAVACSDLQWRAGRTAGETAWLNMLIEVLFKKTYDATLKTTIRANQTAEEAMQKDGIVQAMQALEQKVTEERPGTATNPADVEMAQGPTLREDTVQFMVPITTSDGVTNRRLVTMDDVPEQQRAGLASSCENARLHLRAQVELAPYVDEELLGTLLKATAGREQVSPMEPSYTAIFYDPQLSGEPMHRPAIRTAPLRAVYQKIIAKVLARFGDSDEELPAGDLYFLFDNGKSGNTNDLLKPFMGKSKVVKQFLIHKEQESVAKRYKKVRGCAALQLHEMLNVVSSQMLKIPNKTFLDYPGSIAGSTIGPVVMPLIKDCWSISWKAKKEIYGTANLIAVGGKISDELEDLDFGNPPRTPETVECAFHHSFPGSFYLELLHVFPIGAIIDLTPGEGLFAFAAHERNIKYFGLCMSPEHQRLLRERLDVLALAAMFEEGHALYDPMALAAVNAGQVSSTREATSDRRTQSETGTGDRQAQRTAPAAKRASGAGRGTKRNANRNPVGQNSEEEENNDNEEGQDDVSNDDMA